MHLLWQRADGIVSLWNIAASGSFTSTVYPSAITSAGLRIAAGTVAAYTDSQNNKWTADYGAAAGASITTSITVTGTPDPLLYQTQRMGSVFSYVLPVPNGNYILGLLFAETQATGQNQRLFTVKAGSQTLLDHFDVFAAAGGANKAISRSFNVKVTGGNLVLTLTGNTGNAALAGLLLAPVPASGGVIPSIPGQSNPLPDIPPPGWAEDTAPTDDSSDSDGLGPSSGGPVNLASGVEENSPGPDLWAYNPLGPSATYERRYRSARAKAGYASPGLSAGWTDNYDLSVTFNNSSTSPAYTITYPNGGQEIWTGATGNLTTLSGTPYLVNVSGNTLIMTFKDRSKYTFIQVATVGGNYAANTYLLTKISNLVGHAITVNRDTAAYGYRVLTIKNDAASPVTLLTLAYNGSQLSTATDAYSRQITYGFTGSNLTSVSQIVATGTSNPPALWKYGYATLSGQPYLDSVQAPDPSLAQSYAASTTTYFDNGAVAAHQDATGRTRSYGYQGSQTSVQASNADGSIAETWQQLQGVKNVDTGITDAHGKTDSISYVATPSPYLPSAFTNRNNQQATITYDSTNTHGNYGNVGVVTRPRGVVETTTYGHPTDFWLDQPSMVQRTHVNLATGTTDSTQAATTFAYYGLADIPTDGGPAGIINGLVKSVTTPLPGTVNNTPSVTTTYTYDKPGNVYQMTTPNANGTVTVTYNYTAYSYTDANNVVHSYTKTEALGEPVSVTVSGPDSAGNTTSAVTYSQYDSRGNVIASIDALGNETDTIYTLADQVLAVQYPAITAGLSGAYSYSTYQYPGGSPTSVALYPEGTSYPPGQAAPFRKVNYVYDAEGSLLSVSGDTYPVSYSYDGRNRLHSVTYYGLTLMSSFTTYYDYDAVGNLADIRYPNQSGATFDQVLYSYDADSNLIKEINGNNVEKEYQRYDPTILVADPESLVRTLHYVYPPQYADPTHTEIADVGFTYDNYGRRASLTDSSGSKTYAYDDLDDLTSVTANYGVTPFNNSPGPQGQQITYQYNPDGSRNQWTWQDVTQSYSYDGLGRMTSTIFPGSGTDFVYSYLSNGWMKRSLALYYSNDRGTYAPYLQTDYGYNPRGFMTALTNSLIANPDIPSQLTPLSSFSSMTYDATGNRLGETAAVPLRGSAPSFSRSIQYGYDNFDELTQEVSTPAPGAYNSSYTHNWAFDFSGNSTVFRLGNSSSNLFNADNQFTLQPYLDSNGNIQTTAPTYNGNGDPLTYPLYEDYPYLPYPNASPSFDPEDRMTYLPGLGTPYNVIYDGDGLRTWNYPSDLYNGTYYLYDGSRPVVEEDDQSQSLAVNGFGAAGMQLRYYTGSVNSANPGSNVYTYDPQGNVVQTVFLPLLPNENNGLPPTQVMNSSFYDANGLSYTVTADAPEEHTDPVGFGGQFGYYKDSATQLYLLTHRYYDPIAGRFLTRDPIGYGGGINLYGFADDNPVNESDPNGTQGVGGVDPVGIEDLGVQVMSSLAKPYLDRLGRFVNRNINLIATGFAVNGMIQSGVTGAGPQIPHGFKDEEAYKNFCNNLTDGLRKQGYGGTQPIFMGSSVTGAKYTTGEPFDVGRTSDYDIALADPDLLEKASEAGIEMRGGGIRTGPLNSVALKKLGLDELSKQLSQQAGRKVSFMIYKNPGAALGRGSGIMVWPGHTE